MKPDRLRYVSLDLISRSSLIDFATALDWAKWCRGVADAAKDGDEDQLRLLANQPAPRLLAANPQLAVAVQETTP